MIMESLEQNKKETGPSKSYFLSTTSSSASLAIVLLEKAALRPRTLEGRLFGLPDSRL